MLSLMRDNFSSRMDPLTSRTHPARVPQLLCLLYTQYKPGDCMLPMERTSQCTGGDESKLIYNVSDTDGLRCLEIRNLFYSQAEHLCKFMDVSRIVWQIVLVTRATELYRKLGHTYRTVFDDKPQLVRHTAPTDIEWLGQRQEYDLLWDRMHAILFPDRPEWA